MFRILSASRLLRNQSRIVTRSFTFKTSNYKTKIRQILYAIGSACTLTVLYQLKSVIRKPIPVQIESVSPRHQFNFIDKVVKKCSPSVVYITIQNNAKVDPQTNQPQIISNGSGFIIDENGWILTNAHVVIGKPNNAVTVVLGDGNSYDATVENADMNVDLALLKINAKKKLPYLSLGNSPEVVAGEWVVALGSPLSLSHSVTAGIVSSVDRKAEELGLRNQSMRYIQTDATTTFGNSGGPLVNLDGDVIGINNLRVTAGISFAIPIEYAKRFLESSKSIIKPVKVNYRHHKTEFLGIVPMFVTPHLIATLNQYMTVPISLTSGILVWKIKKDTPAHIGGLQQGDIVTEINNINVTKISDMYQFIKEDVTSLTMKVIRDGNETMVKINLL